jgi:hypothetical protein
MTCAGGVAGRGRADSTKGQGERHSPLALLVRANGYGVAGAGAPGGGPEFDTGGAA